MLPVIDGFQRQFELCPALRPGPPVDAYFSNPVLFSTSSVTKHMLQNMTTEKMEQPDGFIQQILGGTEHIVSHPGTSQYGGRDGISACGLACLNFARVIFAKEAMVGSHNLIQTVIASETAQVGL
jgi:hypothetical protein